MAAACILFFPLLKVGEVAYVHNILFGSSKPKRYTPRITPKRHKTVPASATSQGMGSKENYRDTHSRACRAKKLRKNKVDNSNSEKLLLPQHTMRPWRVTSVNIKLRAATRFPGLQALVAWRRRNAFGMMCDQAICYETAILYHIKTTNGFWCLQLHRRIPMAFIGRVFSSWNVVECATQLSALFYFCNRFRRWLIWGHFARVNTLVARFRFAWGFCVQLGYCCRSTTFRSESTAKICVFFLARHHLLSQVVPMPT